MTDPTISLCMIVKNEENDLEACLSSIKGVVDEMVIIDTGSTDRTVEIAKSFDARIIEITWPENFSTARNISLEAALMDWILVLDADEKLDSAATEVIKTHLTATRAAALRLIQRNLYPQSDLVRYHDIPITRLWRRDARVYYEGAIHESVVESIGRIGGEIENTNFVIWHSGYQRAAVQGGGSRAERNLQLLEKMLNQNPNDAYVNYQYGITCKQLGRNIEAKAHLLKVLNLDTRGLTPAIMSEILMKLAQIESSENNNQQCIKFAESSLVYEPSNVISMYLAALGYMALGNMQKAYPHFLKIRQSHSDLVTDIAQLDVVLAYCRNALGIT